MSSRLRSAAAFGLSLTIATALVILDSVVTVEAQTRLTQQDADRCQGKLGRIAAFAAKPKAAAGSAAATQTTQLTDAELNAYIKFNLKNEVPAGVVDPTLTAVGDGKVRGAAVIDLDTVRKQKQRSWTDPLGYMTGKLPLTASGLLITQNGIGRFQQQAAGLGGRRQQAFPLLKVLVIQDAFGGGRKVDRIDAHGAVLYDWVHGGVILNWG